MCGVPVLRCYIDINYEDFDIELRCLSGLNICLFQFKMYKEVIINTKIHLFPHCVSDGFHCVKEERELSQSSILTIMVLTWCHTEGILSDWKFIQNFLFLSIMRTSINLSSRTFNKGISIKKMIQPASDIVMFSPSVLLMNWVNQDLKKPMVKRIRGVFSLIQFHCR